MNEPLYVFGGPARGTGVAHSGTRAPSCHGPTVVVNAILVRFWHRSHESRGNEGDWPRETWCAGPPSLSVLGRKARSPRVGRGRGGAGLYNAGGQSRCANASGRVVPPAAAGRVVRRRPAPAGRVVPAGRRRAGRRPPRSAAPGGSCAGRTPLGSPSGGCHAPLTGRARAGQPTTAASESSRDWGTRIQVERSRARGFGS